MQTSLFENTELIEVCKPALRQAEVTRSAFGYRFKITNKQNGTILGTGHFTSSTIMTKAQQIDFFHKYTHGAYLHQVSFINVDIYEADV